MSNSYIKSKLTKQDYKQICKSYGSIEGRLFIPLDGVITSILMSEDEFVRVGTSAIEFTFSNNVISTIIFSNRRIFLRVLVRNKTFPTIRDIKIRRAYEKIHSDIRSMFNIAHPNIPKHSEYVAQYEFSYTSKNCVKLVQIIEHTAGYTIEQLYEENK